MKTKTLYFIFVSIIICSFSCKKRVHADNNIKEETPEESTNKNVSSAEQTRLTYYRDNYYKLNFPISTLTGFDELKGNLKTVFIYDSANEELRKYQAFNEAGYLTEDISYDLAIFPDGTYKATSNHTIVYDNNNFVITDVTLSARNGGDSIRYEIKDDENIVMEKWFLQGGGSSWEPDFKHTYTYQSKGKIATDTSFSYDEIKKIWEPESVTVNEYKNDNIITSTDSKLAFSPTNRSRITYEYDQQGNPKTVRTWLTQDADKTWYRTNTYYFEITYW